MWDVKKPYFLVGFEPSVNSNKLKIPSRFIVNLEQRTSGTVTLEGPSGNMWHADLIQHDNDLFIDNGWEDFAIENYLEQGDSLVIRYDGNLNFTVQVFDQTSCEKEDSFKAVSSHDQSTFMSPIVKKRDRQSSSLLDSIVEGIPKKMRSSKNHETNRDEMLCLTDNMTQPSNYNSVTIAIPLQSIPVSDNNSGVTISKTGKEGTVISLFEAEKIAREFTSSFPNFTAVMKRFNISGSFTLNLPYKFAMAHLPKTKVQIILSNLKGESWTVNSIPTPRAQTSHTFCGGWLGFVRDNNINMGDICIFELLRKYELRVRIIRVGDQGPVNCLSTHKTSGRRTKKYKGKSLNTLIESDMLGKTSPIQKQVSQVKGCFSMKSAPEEKLAAQSFVSNFPYFVRIMKKFNVCGSYTLKIPYQFSIHLPSCRTEIILRNLKGERWSVNSVPTTKVQTLHTLCGGWMAFVRENEIQMGDICIFELVGHCEMRVHITKSIITCNSLA